MQPNGMFGSPAAQGMETGSGRPDEDCPKIAFFCAEPIDEASGKQIGDSIYDRENRCNVTIVAVGPVKLGRYEVFPGQRQNLTVHVVDCCRKKQQ